MHVKICSSDQDLDLFLWMSFHAKMVGVRSLADMTHAVTQTTGDSHYVQHAQWRAYFVHRWPQPAVRS